MSPTHEMSRLSETIARLEARVAALEKILLGRGDSLTLSCGASTLTLKRTSIEMQSSEVTIKSSGKILLKASGNIVLKGANITEN